MKLLHESKFWKFGYNAELDAMEYEWFSTSEDMSTEEYKEEMTKNAEEYKKHGPSKSLIDTRQFLFTITPEVQEWTDKEIFPVFVESGLKKLAFVVSQSLFAQVSVEQMLDEQTASQHFQSQYFDDRDKALAWLKS